jgi:hypothetical protein
LEGQRRALATAGAGTLARKRGIRAFLTLANEVSEVNEGRKKIPYL